MIKLLNVIPNVENYEPNLIYLYDNKDAVKQFIFLPFNRDIRVSHVNKMYRDIKEGNSQSSYFPAIEVDIKDFAILEGQNRFKAFCKCWEKGIDAELKVVYVDIPYDKRVDYLKNKNTNQRNWILDDYGKALKYKDEKTYNKILSFALKNKYCHNNKNKINWRYTFQFLFGTNKTKDLHNFEIKVSPKDIEKGQQIHNEIEMLFNNKDIKTGGWLEMFIGAYRELRLNDKKFNENINIYGFKKFVNTFPINEIEYVTDFTTHRDLIRDTAIKLEFN